MIPINYSGLEEQNSSSLRPAINLRSSSTTSGVGNNNFGIHMLGLLEALSPKDIVRGNEQPERYWQLF